MAEKHNDIVIELQEIGLSEKEAQVYVATLELGQETVQNIAQHAGVNRATTYVVLESLQKKGIVTTFDQGKKTVFIAEGPSALHNIIREQQAELQSKENMLEQMMPQLMSVYNLHPDKPKVTFYDGKEGLKEMLDDHFMKTVSKTARLIFPQEQVEKLFTSEEKQMIRQRRIGQKINVSAIYSEENPKKVMSELAEIFPISQHKYPLNCEIEIFDEKVLLASLTGNISGIVIENKKISETIASVFDLAKKAASAKW